MLNPGCPVLRLTLGLGLGAGGSSCVSGWAPPRPPAPGWGAHGRPRPGLPLREPPGTVITGHRRAASAAGVCSLLAWSPGAQGQGAQAWARLRAPGADLAPASLLGLPGGPLPPCPPPAPCPHVTAPPLCMRICARFLWFQGHQSYCIQTHPEDLILSWSSAKAPFPDKATSTGPAG